MSETSQTLETSPNGEFSLSQARSIVGEFFKPNPWIFWPDFLISWTVGLICFGLVLQPEKVTDNVALHWPLSILFFTVSGLLYYRSVLFIHELVHIRAGEFTAFRIVWNLLCGIPFLVPTFLYYTHLDHHRRKHYGTSEDGEYIPLARLPIWQLFVYLAQIPLVPILAVIRFGLLTPLTWISRPIRDLVHRRASSMIMDPMYIRPLPTKRVLRIIRIQEVGCFLFIWFIGIRFFTSFGLLATEPLPKMLLVQIYLTAIFILTLNALRTLGAHRWTNNGEEMNFVDQMLDSVNYPYNPILGALWAPVGLRFHALHHIFPTMPYHALATAHKRLMAELPADSPYRRCEARTLTGALWLLWKRARNSGRGVPPTEIAAPA
ncbi:MAG: fatty acid desaturase [Lacipirellulaceae bacterium]